MQSDCATIRSRAAGIINPHLADLATTSSNPESIIQLER